MAVAEELAFREVVHAAQFLVQPTDEVGNVGSVEDMLRSFTYDDLADAAETLVRAANRIAPEGHRLTFGRS